MTANLLKIFNDFINVMKMTEGVLGEWNFGSALHEICIFLTTSLEFAIELHF